MEGNWDIILSILSAAVVLGLCAYKCMFFKCVDKQSEAKVVADKN